MEQELRQKEKIINEINARQREMDTENRKNSSLIEGYKNIVKEKAQ